MAAELKLPSEWPEDFEYTDNGGLTDEQAETRMREGLGNVMEEDQGKTLKKILFDNVFTFFNFLNFGLAACLLLVGSYRNMLFITIILANILIGTVQEYRAQKTIREPANRLSPTRLWSAEKAPPWNPCSPGKATRFRSRPTAGSIPAAISSREK